MTGETQTQVMEPPKIQTPWLQAIKFRMRLSTAGGMTFLDQASQQAGGWGTGTGSIASCSWQKLGPFSSPRLPGDAFLTGEQPVLMVIISECP